MYTNFLLEYSKNNEPFYNWHQIKSIKTDPIATRSNLNALHDAEHMTSSRTRISRLNNLRAKIDNHRWKGCNWINPLAAVLRGKKRKSLTKTTRNKLKWNSERHCDGYDLFKTGWENFRTRVRVQYKKPWVLRQSFGEITCIVCSKTLRIH